MRELSPEVKARQALERAVVRILWDETQKAGYTKIEVAFDDSEEVATSLKELTDHVFSVDDLRVYFTGNKHTHWVYIVLGNDGYDAISDYSYNDNDPTWSEVMDRVNKRTDKLEPEWR